MSEEGGEGSSDEPRSRHCSDSTDSTDSTASTLSLPTPPDGGWGWVVVLGSFVAHCIADGCAFTFGVLYTELLKYFKESKGMTALVGSLFVSVPLITAPIASALTNKYGCRPVTMVGGLIAATGFILSAFVDSVEMLCVTFGGIAGFGLSMVYVPAVCIVAFYFEKRRAFATGIAVAGSGIGTFLFAPLIEQLIEEYGWRGALLIIGGIMLNITVSGALFRPLRLPRHKPRKKAGESVESSVVHVDDSTRESPEHEHPLIASPRVDLLIQDPVTHSLVQLPTFAQQDLSPSMAAHLLRPSPSHKPKINDGYLQTFYATQSLNRVNAGSGSKKDVVTVIANGGTTSKAVDTGNHCNGQSGQQSHLKVSKSPLKKENSSRREQQQHVSKACAKEYMLSLPMYRNDIFYRGSLPRMTAQSRTVSCPDVFVHRDKGQVDNNKASKKLPFCDLVSMPKEAKHILRKMLDIALLRSPVFLNLVLHSTLLYMWYDVPYVYVSAKALDMDIQEGKASFLIAIIGIASTVGQVVIGYVGDQPRINALHLYNVLTCIAGVATMLVPIMHSYPSLCSYAAVYGFFISGNYALTTIILVNLLGMDKLTNAYGIIMFGEGISNLIGPPLAGWISDYTGSYDLTFYLSGAMILISGLMLSVVPCLQRCDKTSARATSSPVRVTVHDTSSSSSNSSSRGSSRRSSKRASLQQENCASQGPQREVLLIFETESVI